MKDVFHEGKAEPNALEAQYNAQRIAFAPIIFQAARALRDLGVLKALDQAREGLDLAALIEATGLSEYGLELLLETGMSADIVRSENGRWLLTKTGWFILKDEMTNINMDYNHYVNYKGLFHLDECIKQEKPIGLREFGDWPVIYPGLSSLPPKVRDSWFRFDHYYSDSALKAAREKVIAENPERFLEIGGNTGKFSMSLAESTTGMEITLLDLPEQIALVTDNLAKHGLQDRIRTVAADVLDDVPLQGEYDLIWMSQFLDCFSKADIVRILKKAKAALSHNGQILIMEPLWDRQRFETSAYCIINTSPYFTAMANGYSKMYSLGDFERCIADAGLAVVDTIDGLGVCQTIISCRSA
jgi:ubiquinone/menaquinone biosynthesis C-methylase UbiE